MATKGRIIKDRRRPDNKRPPKAGYIRPNRSLQAGYIRPPFIRLCRAERYELGPNKGLTEKIVSILARLARFPFADTQSIWRIRPRVGRTIPAAPDVAFKRPLIHTNYLSKQNWTPTQIYIFASTKYKYRVYCHEEPIYWRCKELRMRGAKLATLANVTWHS